MGKVKGLRGLLPALVALCLLSVGCGTQQSADLFTVERSGKIPGANLTLLVNDSGTVVCNGGKPQPLPSELLLDARDIARQLAADSSKPITGDPPINWIYRFQVQLGAGKLDWIDGSLGLPESYLRLSQFTRKVAKGPCHLVR